MNFTPLNEQLKRATDRLADSLVEMFQNVLQGVAGDIAIEQRAAKAASKAQRTSKAAPKATRGRKPAAAKPVKAAAKTAKAVKPAKAPKAVAKARGGRRTAEELEQFGQRVYDLLKQRPQGMRIEQINAELGTSTSDLMRPIKKMLDEKRLTKKGNRRATVYFAG